MGVRPAALALALLMFVPLVSASWSQYGGDATRTQAAAITPGPLDILGSSPFPRGLVLDPFWSAGALATPDGIVVLLHSVHFETCVLAVFDDALGDARATYPIDRCSFYVLDAYDEATHAAIFCDANGFSTGIIQAIDVRDGKKLWSIDGAALSPLPGETAFYCMSAALDPATREIFVPVNECCAVRAPRLAVLDASTGAVKRSSTIPSQAGLNGAPSIPISEDPPLGYESYHGIALTSTGVILSGYFQCVDGTCNEGVTSWFDRQGGFSGKERSATGDPRKFSPDSIGRDAAVSKFAVTKGTIGATVLGNEILLVNPELPAPRANATIRAISPNSFAKFVTPGLWADDMIVATLGTSLTGFTAGDLQQRWSWSEGTEVFLDSVALTSGHEILVSYNTARDSASVVALVNTQTGKTDLRLPLSIKVPDSETRTEYDTVFSPMSNGSMLFIDDLGDRVLLGVADQKETPRVGISNAYPPVGGEVTLALQPAPGMGVKSYQIAWGDGSEDDVAAGASAHHVYATRGDVDARITARSEDGRTRSAVATLHVGAPPPPQLTTLQKAFAPENQNITFFVLGTVVTILGAAFTIGRHRRRLAKLERELEAVEEIRMLSVEDPRGATLSLKRYRDRLPEDLARRRIDDSQYQILDQRSGRLLKVLRTRMFAPFDARLSMRYHRLLDAAFEDAILQPSERTALVSALAEESIAPEERAAIVAILDDFTSQRAV